MDDSIHEIAVVYRLDAIVALDFSAGSDGSAGAATSHNLALKC